MANSVDSNADCSRLVVDGWLDLEFKVPEEALRVLTTALSLRGEWERLLLHQLGQGPAGNWSTREFKKTLEKLSDGLVRFILYTEVQMFDPFKYVNLVVTFSILSDFLASTGQLQYA